MFVVFEGVDCSGKSETSVLLASRLGAYLCVTPPKRYGIERQRVDSSASDNDHYRFYLAAVREASEEIRLARSKGLTVVCDRYDLTTKVYHRVMGVQVERSDFEGIEVPDVTIYLTVDQRVQAKRFVMRGLSAGDRRMINRQDALMREYENALSEVSGGVIRIDTSRTAQADVVEQIVASLPTALHR